MTIDDWRVRYLELSAEMDRLKAENAVLRARVTPEVIAEKHRDGNWWLLWSPDWEAWIKGRWSLGDWRYVTGPITFGGPTHALPLPPAPEGL